MNDRKILMALYENRKKFLVVNYRLHGGKCGLSKSYIYAISHDLCPVFSQDVSADGDDQDPYSDCYTISSGEVSEVLEYIDNEWIKGRVHDYYTLERHFGGRPGRCSLICILRYCFLDDRFDEALWNKLMEAAPIEAKSISREPAEWEI